MFIFLLIIFFFFDYLFPSTKKSCKWKCLKALEARKKVNRKTVVAPTHMSEPSNYITHWIFDLALIRILNVILTDEKERKNLL